MPDGIDDAARGVVCPGALMMGVVVRLGHFDRGSVSYS